MNKNEKIRKYLEGELTGSELKEFENEILQSPSLKKEIDDLQKTINQFSSLKNVKADERYFNNILPVFHSKDKKTSSFILKPVYTAGSLAAVLIAAIIFFFVNSGNENEEIMYQNLTYEEINEYLNDYSADYLPPQFIYETEEEYDSLLSSMIEVEFNSELAEDYFSELFNEEYYSFINNLSDDEIDMIYNNLTKKDF